MRFRLVWVFAPGRGDTGNTWLGPLSRAATVGITPRVRHSDYIGAWIDTMREASRVVFRAASQVSKAAIWILSLQLGRRLITFVTRCGLRRV
ncbi:zincin-like metallopeptidase domain-containing protein [Mesorhizobium australicum]|uniref:zincin-like metallopeptidase domain-containing protein n=1 Tax=Mesorhizobium australicum TaxID=536018 RepID=UPI003D791D15